MYFSFCTDYILALHWNPNAYYIASYFISLLTILPSNFLINNYNPLNLMKVHTTIITNNDPYITSSYI